MNLIEREAVRVFVMCWCFIEWPMRENELVTDTVDLEEEKRNWWCWVFKMLLFVLVSTLVPIAEDGKLIMWIPKHLHTCLYRPRNISILNHSFFVKIHFGTEWNTRRNIFVSHFHFLSLSFLYRLVSYLSTPIVLLSFYFFLKWELFVMVIIRVYQSCSSETDIDFICLPRICILYTFH